jgi:hypothetical protein
MSTWRICIKWELLRKVYSDDISFNFLLNPAKDLYCIKHEQPMYYKQTFSFSCQNVRYIYMKYENFKILAFSLPVSTYYLTYSIIRSICSVEY